VKEARIRETVTEVLKGSAEPCRVAVHASRDAAQPVRAVIDGVHRGHDRQQHLRGADIARRFFAADMLLARLQRHAQAGAAGAVLGYADDPARQVALELVARREERGMRAAVAERDAETLGVTDGDV